jgi:hypothetical protein
MATINALCFSLTGFVLLSANRHQASRQALANQPYGEIPAFRHCLIKPEAVDLMLDSSSLVDQRLSRPETGLEVNESTSAKSLGI